MAEENQEETVTAEINETVAETEFTLSLASKFEFIAGVVGWVDLDSNNAKDDIDKLSESKYLKGFRPMIHDIQDDAWMLNDHLKENIKYLNTKNLTFAENFFYMCFGKVPQKEIVKAFDVSLILYAEHSFNVSTFTARTITSSLSDIHGAITGAIASLKGPLHGGANEEVMHMMNKIKDPKNALKWINDALDNKEVVMGFGHRVYKSGDSRVPTMRKYFAKVAKIKKDKKFEKIYDIVEKVMIERKNIHPNVDYPTGPTYHLMGFDTDFFTPIFVISRITGWSAHIMEQHAANKLIRPLASYKGNKHRKVLQLNQR